jgi:tetraacyldisaccharide 4'-kinase
LFDEPAILARSCPRAEVVVNPDRVAGAARAVREFEADVLVMDDGFQHRRLGRDVDIVTVDATRPFGYGRLLPAGLLREPVSGLKRADAMVITRSEQVSERALLELEQRLAEINGDAILSRTVHRPIGARLIGYEQISLEELKERKVFAFCGIGNPEGFVNTLTGLGVEVVGTRLFNDHHHYTSADISDIRGQAREVGAEVVLTTQKDWMKTVLPASAKKDIPFAYLEIELAFTRGEDELKGLVAEAVAQKV